MIAKVSLRAPSAAAIKVDWAQQFVASIRRSEQLPGGHYRMLTDLLGRVRTQTPVTRPPTAVRAYTDALLREPLDPKSPFTFSRELFEGRLVSFASRTTGAAGSASRRVEVYAFSGNQRVFGIDADLPKGIEKLW